MIYTDVIVLDYVKVMKYKSDILHVGLLSVQRTYMWRNTFGSRSNITSLQVF